MLDAHMWQIFNFQGPVTPVNGFSAKHKGQKNEQQVLPIFTKIFVKKLLMFSSMFFRYFVLKSFNYFAPRNAFTLIILLMNELNFLSQENKAAVGKQQQKGKKGLQNINTQKVSSDIPIYIILKNDNKRYKKKK